MGQQQFDMLKQYRIGGSLDKNKFTKLIVAHVIRECTSLYYLRAYLQREKGSPAYARSTGMSEHQMSHRHRMNEACVAEFLLFYLLI